MIGRIVSIILLLTLGAPAFAGTLVTLQLKWSHSFQFAGYYAALEKGYYREAGLDVRIEEAMPGVNAIDQVLSGEADFGVGTSDLLRARAAGRPVVVLAVIFQHSPLVMIARKRYADQSLRDIIGKQVMIDPQSSELLAYLKQEGIPLDGITQLQHSFNPQDLIDGHADAISAYATNEVYYLDKAGLSYQIFTPRSAGIDFYGDNLFTSARQIEQHPDRVRAFREASLRGWKYALDHPEEIARLIQSQYRGQHDLDFYRFESRQMLPLIDAGLVEVGYMNPDRWHRIANTYANLGMLPRDPPLTGFLYDPAPKADSTKLRWYLFAVLALMAIIGILAIHFHRVKRRLERSIDTLQTRQTTLSESETALRALIDTTAAGVYVLRGNRFAMVNPALVALSGHAEAEMLAMDFQDLIHPEHRAMVMEYAAARSRGGQVAPRHEFRMLARHGGIRWVELTVERITLSGESASVGTIYDITARKRVEERTKHMARHDELTGLANRSLFADRFKQALASAKRDHYQLGLLYLDLGLDQLKDGDAPLGHAVADSVLKEMARRITECIRDSDTAARMGGDEFAVLLRTIEESRNASAVAEKIRQALGRPMTVAGHRLRISANIGIAIYPEHGVDEMELIRNADSALCRARETGSGNIQMFQYEDQCT
ncbi:hypothetical protein B9N43_04385 [Denitratisoma sp. DHT3]|nr:hypothetical protein B9N43_04385 [Denitratisoma sp. DHT3]